MADTKLTALTETTSPATSDDVYVVTTPGGTPASKRCTIANLKTAMGVIAPAMVLIGSTVLGSDTASLAVASIPSGYKALEIHAWVRGKQAATSIWSNGVINDDTGGNYDLIQTTSDNAGYAKTVQNAASSFSIGTIPADSATAGMFAQIRIFINEYAGSNYKVITVDDSYCYGTAAGNIGQIWDTCFWRSTAAITKVAIVSAANISTGSKMYVYGIV